MPIQKDGVFHFAAKEQGESVRLSEDYFIEARVDGAPTVKITHPGSDARVNPIEEVGVTVEADDDFALQGVELHYSVNGGAEKVVPIPNSKGVKDASGKTLIALEDYKMEPGDVIAMYATAKDAHVTSRTDMLFVQAEPFERNYTQSQQRAAGAAVAEATTAARFRSGRRKSSPPPGTSCAATPRIKPPRTLGSWPKCRRS